MPNEFEDSVNYANDSKRLLTTLQRWSWFLILMVAVGAGSTYLYSRLQTPVYEATTSILVTRNSQQTLADLSQTLSLSQLVDTYVRMLSLDEFLETVSQRLSYKVETRNVDVSAFPNTQVIQLQVRDNDPIRATRIADTMVVVLEEQTDTLIAGRYAEAEQSLDIQIQEIETRIAEIQAKLNEAKAGTFNIQIAQVQANIDTTVTAIKNTTIDLDRLHKMDWPSVHSLLNDNKTRLAQQQALLAQQIAENDTLKDRFSSDPQVQTDLTYAVALQAQITDMDVKVEKTRQLIKDIQNDIELFAPLDTQQSFISTVVEKENFLTTQQSLLTAFQAVYSNLVSSEEVKRTTNEIDNLTQNLDLYHNIDLNLLSSREDVKKQKLQNIPSIEQIRPALASENPVKPRMFLNTLLGGLAGLILALMFVLLRDLTDDTLKDSQEVEKTLGTKVLGYISELKDKQDGEGIYVGRAPDSPVADAFRALRTHLEFSDKEKPIKTILVTSGGPAEGKTTIASNLAAILSQSGKKVILVDANLRRPRVHQYTGVSNAAGLSDLIGAKHEVGLNDVLQKLENFPNLHILPGGKLLSNPTDLLGSEKMQNLLRTLADAYDSIVIDCPPMLVADPQVLLGRVDGVLLVLVPGKTRKEVVHAVKEQMQHAGVRLLGVVFTRLQYSRRAGYGGYSYYDYPYYYFSDYAASKAPDGDDAGKKKGFWERGSKKKRKAPEIAPELSGD